MEAAITELGVGEALVSFLNEKGQPDFVDRALIFPPQSQLAPLSGAERKQIVQQSAIYGHYEKVADRESAYEMLKDRAAQAPAGKTASPPADEWQAQAGKLAGALAKSAAHAIGSQVGREIIRGVLGSIFGGTTTRRRR